MCVSLTVRIKDVGYGANFSETVKKSDELFIKYIWYILSIDSDDLGLMSH